MRSAIQEADFAGLVELIRASVDSESWNDGAAIQVDVNTMGLVVRQTAEHHDQIVELLSELRNASDRQVCITCQFVALTSPRALDWLAEEIRLQDGGDSVHWSLLSETRGAEVRAELRSWDHSVMSAPKVTVFEGQMASLRLENPLLPDHGGQLLLNLRAEILSNSGILRLWHDVRTDVSDSIELAGLTTDREPVEKPIRSTLMRDGQTLLLSLPTGDASDRDAGDGRLVVLISPRRLTEAEFQAR